MELSSVFVNERQRSRSIGLRAGELPVQLVQPVQPGAASSHASPASYLAVNDESGRRRSSTPAYATMSRRSGESHADLAARNPKTFRSGVDRQASSRRNRRYWRSDNRHRLLAVHSNAGAVGRLTRREWAARSLKCVRLRSMQSQDAL